MSELVQDKLLPGNEASDEPEKVAAAAPESAPPRQPKSSHASPRTLCQHVRAPSPPTFASRLAVPSATLPDKEKISKYIDAAAQGAGNVNPALASCLSACKPFIVLPIQLVSCIAPFYAWAYQWAYVIYTWLPKQAVMALFGVALCFFGGTYVASIAAIEAFRQMGFNKLLDDVATVRTDLATVMVAMAHDEEELAKDKDGNGVADGDELNTPEKAQRTAFVVLNAIKKPDRLQGAVGSLWAAYIAVLATLKLEFARTTALALGIVEVVKVPCVRFLSPLVVTALHAAPADIKLDADGMINWSVTIIESTLTIVAVIFAWYLQMIISAFYSGLRGGRMFADAACAMLIDYGLMEHLPFVAKPFVAEESYLDEILGFSVAAVGFCFQFFAGFSLPFPLNIIFLPLTIIEWFLRAQISMTAVGVY